MPLQITERAGAVVFDVRVVPRASRDGILGEHGGALKVQLTAPPVEGAANEALRRLLAKALGVSRSAVSVVRGDRSRDKSVRVEGATADDVRGLVAAD